MTAARGPGAATHPCPCGCGQQIRATRLMCRTSWYQVPKPLRDQVWATWRNGDGAGTPEHGDAIRAAVASLTPPPRKDTTMPATQPPAKPAYLTSTSRLTEITAGQAWTANGETFGVLNLGSLSSIVFRDPQQARDAAAELTALAAAMDAEITRRQGDPR